MLDAETWEEKAVIPLDIGRRFFRVKGEREPLPTFGEVQRRLLYSVTWPTLAVTGHRVCLLRSVDR